MIASAKQYTALSGTLAQLYGSPELYGDSCTRLQETLVEGITEVMLTILDHNYEDCEMTTLRERLSSGEEESVLIIADYLESAIEKEESYIILNKFLLDTVLSSLSVLDKDGLDIAEQILDENSLTKADMLEINESWEKLKESINSSEVSSPMSNSENSTSCESHST